MRTIIEFAKIDLINQENYILKLNDKVFLHNLEFEIEYSLKYKHLCLYIEVDGGERVNARTIILDGDGIKKGTLILRFNTIVNSILFSSLTPFEFYLTLYSKQFENTKMSIAC
jgi:hypothetical protein